MSAHATAKRLLAEAMHTGVDAIPEDASIGVFERWDSLAHLRLILAIEQRLSRRLDPDEAVQIESLADVAAILGER